MWRIAKSDMSALDRVYDGRWGGLFHSNNVCIQRGSIVLVFFLLQSFHNFLLGYVTLYSILMSRQSFVWMVDEECATCDNKSALLYGL